MTFRPFRAQAQEPPAVRDYFALVHDPDTPREHAEVAQTFAPGKGWTDHPGHKRVSRAWARRARGEGVQAVAVRSGGRVADFGISELVR